MTLLILMMVAVPAKHLFAYPQLVQIIGPIHGLVFIGYLLVLAEAVAGGGWSAREIVRTAIVSVVPFGPFLNERLIARKVAEAEARA